MSVRFEEERILLRLRLISLSSCDETLVTESALGSCDSSAVGSSEELKASVSF